MFTALVVSYANENISLSPRDALWIWEKQLTVHMSLTLETLENSIEIVESTRKK